MKIRNGFVSNSSSSSFILVYDKTKVTTNPEDIVDILKREPNCDMLIKGWELANGDDIFELDEEQKSLIRKFSDRFIKLNEGEVERDHYEENPETGEWEFVKHKSPAIEAYMDYLIWESPNQWREPEVDMSDIENPNLSLDEIVNHADDPEVIRKKELSENYYKIRGQRQQEARKAEKEKLVAEMTNNLLKRGVSAENVAYEEVDKDNNTSEENNIDFAERYLTQEYFEDTNYDSLSARRHNCEHYAIVYDKVLTDKREILKACENTSMNNYLCWTNTVYNYLIDNDVLNIELYEIDTPELRLMKNENFVNSTRECRLYMNARVVKNTSEIKSEDVNKKIDMGYGQLTIIESGEDLPDFKKLMRNNEE